MRFTLQTLMLSVLVVASSLGAFGPWGLVVAVILLAMVVYIRNSAPMWRAAGMSLLVLLYGSLVLLPALSKHRTGQGGPRCPNNLKFLGISLWNYKDQHGCFPPAYIADANGKPMHSWRVLILPHLEENTLYDQYNFNEPWNGSNNSKLKKPTGFMHDVYNCPSTDTTDDTNYVAVVGPRTVWQNGDSVKLDDIKDGPENTILLIEFPGSDIHWMEPRDLSIQDVLQRFDPKSGLSLSPVHVRDNGYFLRDTPMIHVLFADGSVHAIPADISREDLEGLLTIDGGEEIDVSRLRLSGLRKKEVPQWKKVSAYTVLLFSIVVLLFATRKKAEEPPFGKSESV
ncbi:MAG: DUF1559 domain-containing protein [Thermoguttaceae bacterium]